MEIHSSAYSKVASPVIMLQLERENGTKAPNNIEFGEDRKDLCEGLLWGVSEREVQATFKSSFFGKTLMFL